MTGLSSYLLISMILFLAGIVVIISRKNLIAIFLGIELILNASALTMVAYSRFLTGNIDGHIFALFIIIIAAAEAAIGFAIAIRYFQVRGSTHVDTATLLNDEP